jgi:hypothetical protein
MASLYDLIGADEPTAAEQAAALQKALRRQSAAGVLGSLTGDKVLGQVGQGLQAGADRGEQRLVDVGQFRQRQALQRQNQQGDEAYRQRMADIAQQNANSQEQSRKDLAAYRRDALRAQYPAPSPQQPGPLGPPAPGSNPKGAEDLRKEFQKLPTFQNTQTIGESYRKIQGTSENGPGDVSLIYSYMRMVDPGSTVREGEFATAANAGGVPDRLLGAYNRALKGEKLPPEVRQQFKNEARKLLEAQHDRYEDTAQGYRRLALQQGVNPKDAVMDPGVFEMLADSAGSAPRRPAPGAPAASSRAPQRMQGNDGNWYVMTPAGWEPEGAR